MSDPYPKPVSDPAADGLPEYADDDSTAWDDVDSPRAADGPEPAPLPPDREDGPLAIDEYGTTAEEQRRGEPLDHRSRTSRPSISLSFSDLDGRWNGLIKPGVPVDPTTSLHVRAAISVA